MRGTTFSFVLDSICMLLFNFFVVFATILTAGLISTFQSEKQNNLKPEAAIGEVVRARAKRYRRSYKRGSD